MCLRNCEHAPATEAIKIALAVRTMNPTNLIRRRMTDYIELAVEDLIHQVARRGLSIFSYIYTINVDQISVVT
jgi:hypothetical protein